MPSKEAFEVRVVSFLSRLGVLIKVAFYKLPGIERSSEKSNQ